MLGTPTGTHPGGTSLPTMVGPGLQLPNRNQGEKQLGEASVETSPDAWELPQSLSPGPVLTTLTAQLAPAPAAPSPHLDISSAWPSGSLIWQRPL